MSTLAPSCEAQLSAICRQHCPHAASHELFPRLDTGALGGPAQWRCYARETLSADLSHYVSGSTYCSRDKVLRRIVEVSEACTLAQSENRPITAAVDPRLGQTTMATSGGVNNDHAEQEQRQHQRTSIDIVVAHCREPLGWLSNIQDGLSAGYTAGHRSSEWSPLALNLRLYEKCGGRSGDAGRPRTGWSHETQTFLENKGEECLAYLTFLTEHYDTLADYIIFLQGDGLLPTLKEKAFTFAQTVVAVGRTDVWRSANDHQYIAMGASAEACGRAAMPPHRTTNCMAQLPRTYQCMGELYLRHWGVPMPEVISMWTNAQAGVSRDRILARPKTFYTGLLGEFNIPPDKECLSIMGRKVMGAADEEQQVLMNRPFRGTCALFEYLWPSIFGEAPLVSWYNVMSNETS